MESLVQRLQGLPGNIYVHDLVNDVNVFRSHSLRDMLGYEGTDTLRSGESMRGLVHDDDIEEFIRNSNRVYELVDGESNKYRYRVKHADGRWFWLQSEEYVFQRSSSGRPTMVLGYATDLTETIHQKLHLDKLNRLNMFLLETSRILAENGDPYERILQSLTDSVSEYFDCVCDISILNLKTDEIEPKAISHRDRNIVSVLWKVLRSRTVKKGEGLVGTVIDTGKEILIREVPAEMKVGPRMIDHRIVPESIIYRPLKGSSGTIGTIDLTRLVGQRPFSDEEIDQVRQLANHVSLFVENRLLESERQAEVARRRSSELQLAQANRWAEFKVEMSTLLSGAQSDLTAVLLGLTQGLSAFFEVVCDIQLVDRQTGTILPVAVSHCDPELTLLIQDLFTRTQLKVGMGLIGKVVESGEELYMSDLDESLLERVRQSGIDERVFPSSFLYVPLIGHAGVLGTLNLTRLKGQPKLSEAEVQQAKDLVTLVAGFIDNKLLQVNQLAEIERRKRVESKLERTTRFLERSEAELRSILNTVPIYISRVNRSFQYTFLNAGYRGLGTDPRSLEGRHIAEFIGQENFDNVKSYMDRALAGETVTYDFQGSLGDGLQRYFTVILTPDRSVEGAVTGFYSCITDLTQKVEAELEVKRTQERFETLTLNSGDAFFFHDMDQQILDVNKAASELLGYSREELLSMEAKQIDPRWAGSRFQGFLVTLEENVPQTFETSVITKRGIEVPVEVRFVKRVEAGRIFIQSLLRDRTEKRLQEQRLQNSEQQLRLIFENVEDFIATIGPDGTIESVNRTAQGVRHGDVVGGSVFDWYPEPDTRARVYSAFQELKSSGNGFEVETTDYTAPDGIVRTYYNKYVAIIREDGFYKAILIIRDITAAKHKERTEMRAILKGQESERKRLGAELHDGIGQILSSISLDVSQVKAQAATKADAALVSELEGLASKVQAAIKEVRNISHDLMPDVLESFGLKEALKQTCANLHNRAGVKVIFEHVDLQPKYDPTVEMNLFRVAQELLNNIQKHASSTNVFVSLMDHGDTLSLTVEDDGVGFDPTSESKGIGLSNVASRVKTLSGQMDVESSPESGTMISIEIPKFK